MKQTRFIICSPPRSGSNYLMSLLDSHPDIVCLGEVFNKNFVCTHFTSVHGIPYWLHVTNPVQYVDQLASNYDKQPVFGVKFIHNQALNHLEKFIAEDYKIIVLSRRNYLKQYTSYIYAKKRHIWASVRENQSWLTFTMSTLSEIPLFLRVLDLRALARKMCALARYVWYRAFPVKQITIKKERFMRYIEELQNEEQYLKSISDDNFLWLTYEDLTGSLADSHLAKIQIFLGVEPKPLKSYYQKQATRLLSDRIKNFDEVKSMLKDTPYAWMTE